MSWKFRFVIKLHQLVVELRSEKMEGRKKLFSIFENEFSLILKIFEVFGLQNFGSDQINVREKPSKYRFIYMIIRMMIMVTLMIFYILRLQSKHNNDYSKNDLMIFIQRTMNIGMILSVILSIFQSYFATNELKKFYINSRKILCILNKDLNIDLNFNEIRRKIYIRLFFMCAIFTGFYSISGDFYEYFELTFILSYIPILFFIMTIFHYVFFVDITYHFLLAITKHMQLMSIENRVIEIMTVDYNKIIPVKPVNNSDEKLRSLKLCRAIYNLIYESCSYINDSFGITILIMLMNIVIALTVSGYKIFIMVVENKEFHQFLGKNFF